MLFINLVPNDNDSPLSRADTDLAVVSNPLWK